MKISNRDWIQLSAFLDGELSRREADKLSHRINNDPGLQAALEELKATKEVLRSTPELPVPRNFTLSKSQVGIKTRKPVYRKYQLAAALMSFMLIGVLVLDFGTVLLGGSFAPAAPMAEVVMMEKAVEDSLDLPAEEPALMTEAPPEVSERSTSDEEISADTEEGYAAEAPSAESEAMDGIAEKEVPAEAEGEVLALEEASPPAGTQIGELETGQEESPEELMAAEQPEDADQTNIAEPTSTPLPSPYQTQTLPEVEEVTDWEVARRPVNPLRVLEIIFLVGLLGFGITAWVLRRKFK
jgi:hypothetical protein